MRLTLHIFFERGPDGLQIFLRHRLFEETGRADDLLAVRNHLHIGLPLADPYLQTFFLKPGDEIEVPHCLDAFDPV